MRSGCVEVVYEELGWGWEWDGRQVSVCCDGWWEMQGHVSLGMEERGDGYML